MNGLMNDQAEPWEQPALPRPIALESRPLYRGQSRDVVSGSLPCSRTLTDSRVCVRYRPPQLGGRNSWRKLVIQKAVGVCPSLSPETLILHLLHNKNNKGIRGSPLLGSP